MGRKHQDDESRHRPFRPRPAGYFECRRRIELLEKFKDLVRHDRNCDRNLARPLNELLPYPESDDRWALTREINQLATPVWDALADVGISTSVKHTTSRDERDFDNKAPLGRLVKKETVQKYDIIEQYSGLPLSPVMPRLVVEALDRGIGVYKHRETKAFWEMFNPLVWVARLLRTPIYVLEKAGLVDDETRSHVLKVYAYIVQALVLLILALVAARLGISFPWSALR